MTACFLFPPSKARARLLDPLDVSRPTLLISHGCGSSKERHGGDEEERFHCLGRISRSVHQELKKVSRIKVQSRIDADLMVPVATTSDALVTDAWPQGQDVVAFQRNSQAKTRLKRALICRFARPHFSVLSRLALNFVNLAN